MLNHLRDLKINSKLFQYSHYILFIWLFALIWIGNGKPFYSRGESREAIAAQVIYDTGNWILPKVYSGDVPSKPPFTHWLMVIAAKAQGSFTEFSARFPSALFASIFLLLFAVFLARKYNWVTSFFSTLVLVTSLEWFRAMKTARVDMVLACLMVLSLIWLYQWWQKSSKFYLLLACLSLAGGVLTKGPVAVVIPAAVFGLFLLTEKKKFLSATLITTGIFMIPLALAAMWYFAAWQQGGDLFIKKVFSENFTRFADVESVMPHQHSVFYLYGLFILGALPWTIFSIAAIATTISNLGFKVSWQKLKEALQQDSFLRLSVFLVLAVLIFYAIPSSKRSVYLLPAYPPLAFLITKLLIQTELIENRTMQVVLKITAVLFAIIVSVLLLTFIGSFFKELLLVPDSAKEKINFTFSLLQTGGWSLKLLTVLFSISALSCFIFSTISKKVSFGLVWFLVGFCLVLSFNVVVLMPACAEKLSAKDFLINSKQLVTDEKELYSFKDSFFEGSFYIHKSFLSIEDQNLDNISKGKVFLFEQNLEQFKKEYSNNFNIKIISRSNGSVWKPGKHLLLISINK